MAAEGRDPAAEGSITTIEGGDWPDWCRQATERLSGRTLLLHYQDSALGEITLAEGQPFLGLDYDKLGPSVTLTIKYGDGVVPVRYVIADPREVQQHRDAAGEVQEVTILDGTGRRTFVSLVEGGSD